MTGPRRYNLAEFIETKRRDDGIPVELADGSEIIIPPPVLWPDEALDELLAGRNAEAMALILGHEQTERFRTAGGTWKILDAIVRDTQGASAGESPASSST